MPLLTSLTSTRCIRAWPVGSRGDESASPACAHAHRPVADGCDSTRVQYDRTCRTGVHGASADGDMVPNPASLARRCRRPRG